jgi:pimeloyl-ACP methyl ester carboxylesterase
VVGEIADLSDPRFGAENGRMGLWRPYDFLFNVRAGIYFAEPYDPDRIPVLFVHGISGYPAEFAFLSEQLDRGLFQPWFYYYPSGASLDEVSSHLSNLVVRLRVRFDFDDLYVVAHSMGGLVARSFILKHYESTGTDYVNRFVSISTPWNGHRAAQRGVDRAPVVVDSWRDLAPDSAFINEMFYANPETREQWRPLPEHLDFHLIFGFKRSSRSLGQSSDGVVAVASQLRLGAQRQATTVGGFDHDHAGILLSSDTASRLNALLESD